MTPQEEEMIRGLIDRVQKTQLTDKDFAAEQLLEEGLGRNPDAIYILAQTVLVQKYALEQAQAQLTQAKSQIEQMRQQAPAQAQQGQQHSGSFLGNLLHWSDAPGAPQPPQQTQSQQGYATVPPQYAQAGPPPPPYGQPMGYGVGPGYGAPQGGGFLQNAMQTAAGVAAGALAFEGIESLMHGFGHAAGYGGAGLGGFGGSDIQGRPEVINNYYDDRGGDRSEHGVSAAEREEGGREDRFGNQGDDSQGLQSGAADDSSSRDSFADTNSGSFDQADSGSVDDSSYSDDGSSDGDFGGGGDDSSFS
jgi:uncharacterized protein